MEEVAIVILNFNGVNFLSKFIPTLIINTPSVAKIYIADNASSDNSVQFVKAYFEAVTIIQLAKNFGFAAGYNEALKQIKAKYLVLINSDIEVTPNWLAPLIETLQDKNTAACQPKILDYNNKQSFEYAGAGGGFIDYLGYPFCRGRIINNIEKDNGQYNNNCEIFWATGACFAIKAEKFKEIGGFDGDFFAHMEEIDLCWRLQLNGSKIVYNSQSIVYHVGGGTLHKSNPFKTFLNFRNGLVMVYKNQQENFFFILISRLLMDGLASIGYLLKGDFGDFFAVIKAHFAFYGQIQRLNIKRKEVKSLIKTDGKLENIYTKSILFSYLLKRMLTFPELNFRK